MKIDRIGYGETINTGNYENIKPYFEAELEPWEDPIKSLEILKAKCREAENQKRDLEDYKAQAEKVQSRLYWANQALKRAKERWEAITLDWERLMFVLQTVGFDEEKIRSLKDNFPNTPDFRPVGIEDVKNDDDEDDDDEDDDDIPM